MDDYKSLIDKLNSQSCSREESEKLFDYFLEEAGDREMVKMVSSHLDQESSIVLDVQDREAIDNNEKSIMKLIRIKRINKLRLTWYSAAATLLICFSFLIYRYSSTYKSEVGDVAPGKLGATLTLSDGRKIYINRTSAGNIVTLNGAKVIKTADGVIDYQQLDPKNQTSEFNTLATSNGEHSQVILSDGTKVMLNSSSSVKFPTNFAGQGVRRVYLTGEGYFEVSKDKSHPFIVVSATQQVKVLGTKFNINAYPNENAVRTTLLEGAVKINDSKVLKPGELALEQNGRIVVQHADLRSETAWVDNDFYFNNEDLESVMRKVSRWYNISFTFSNEELKKIPLNGHLSRNKSLMTMLNGIGMTTNVSFKLNGTVVEIRESSH